MTVNPEGLSPCYFSLASPDIPASHYFKWMWAGQTSATIKIYASDKTTLLKTYNVSGSTQSVEMGSIGYTFTNGTTYYWTVQTQNSGVSVMAKFKYDAVPQNPGITWSSTGIKAGDVITKDSRLGEIKTNLGVLLDNYTGVTTSMRNKVDQLFTGNIVPSKKDFSSLQDVIEFIGIREGIKYTKVTEGGTTFRSEVELVPLPRKQFAITDPVFSPFEETERSNEAVPAALNILEWVGDSLGVSDIDNVIKYIDYLINIPPKAPEEITFDVPATSMYQMKTFSAVSNGVEDQTIDTSWSVNEMNDTVAYIEFNKLSPSYDVWFYDCEFSYGPNGNYKSRLFFRPIDLTTETSRGFFTNWNGLYTDNTLSQATLAFSMITVDNYGNMSPQKRISKNFSSTFRVPIGVDYYVVESQKTDLGTTNYNTTGWSQKYKGTNTSSTYTITNGEGQYWHRAKAVDKSGLETDWMYASGSIKFDPLKVPPKPTNFHANNISQRQVGLYWNPVPTATSYQIYMWMTPGTEIYHGPASGGSLKGEWAKNLTPNTSYNFYVRAGNIKGWSEWAYLTVKTLPDIKESYFDSVHCHTYNYKYGWKSNQGVGHTYGYQGTWDNGGNHAGMYYFDYGAIRDKLRGKEILDVQVSVQRLRAGYSTANYPRFYTHNRDWASWYYNHSTAPGTLSGGHQSDKAFSIDQRQWVKLPKSYGEWLRDGSANGLAIYEPDGSPYLKFHNWAQLYIKYQ